MPGMYVDTSCRSCQGMEDCSRPDARGTAHAGTLRKSGHLQHAEQAVRRVSKEVVMPSDMPWSHA